MSAERLSRRRVLTIFAATAASFAGGGPLRAEVDYEWRGVAMGADARMLFSGIAPADVQAAVGTALAEIERLERALSLFRSDSEICRLNRDGVLHSPSADMRRALALALAVSDATGGLFDPTVQALWEAHVDWFSGNPDAGPPPSHRIAAARAAVDWRRIAVDADAIRLGKGQRITLNGLGQGYVTDRVADLLHAGGMDCVLVDLGEQRALGPRRDGSPWLIAREGASSIALTRGALATSAGAGCVLGAGSTAHHLFDPRTGRSAGTWRHVTVHHGSAAVADALSTALYAASAREIDNLFARFAGTEVWAQDEESRAHRWTASRPTAAGNNL
jgi:thiamine biosynthesis lipoprotein